MDNKTLNQFSYFETKYDWKCCLIILLAKYNESSENNQLLLLLRTLFVMNYATVELNCSKIELELIKNVIIQLKDKLFKNFETNADFLFSISIISGLNEWTFDFDKEYANPSKLLKKAIMINNNPVFTLWQEMTKVQKINILSDNQSIVDNWCEDKGLFGKYISGLLLR